MNDQTWPQNDADWQKKLTPQQYKILRQKGTELAFSGQYYKNHDRGQYFCAGCGAELFLSEHKYDSGCGWPSFDRPQNNQAVILQADDSAGMHRTEVLCARCGGHLGHVFDDGPTATTGQRYCINSVALNFKKK